MKEKKVAKWASLEKNQVNEASWGMIARITVANSIKCKEGEIFQVKRKLAKS